MSKMLVTLQIQKEITFDSIEDDYVEQLSTMLVDLAKQGFDVDVQSEDDV